MNIQIEQQELSTGDIADPSPDELRAAYRWMLLARRLDERTWQLIRQGKGHFAVPCWGHEALGAGYALALRRGYDYVAPHYRDMAAMLAIGFTPRDVLANYFARAADPCSRGRQPYVHWGSHRLHVLTLQGPQPNQVTHGVGIAYGAKLQGEDTVTFISYGDGGAQKGEVHEAMNFAAIHRLPCVFCCENNRYTQSVPLALESAVPSIAVRAAAYGMPGISVDGMDLLAVYRAVAAAVARARSGGGPSLVEANVYASDPRVLVLGEDIGTLGGVFRATEGLLERFGPERVIDTPMAELSIAGIAVGLAMKGLRPVAEIQFADFIHAAADHILGEAAKIRYRSGGDWSCPLVIRTAYGGGFRGGPYHSQSVEAFYTHAPGLKVLAPGTPADAKGLLLSAIRDPDPVLFLEHKRTYRLIKGEVPAGDGMVPIGRAAIARSGTDVTVVSYGMMLHESLAAAELLSAEGISVEVVDLRTLIPLDRNTILQSLQRTGRLCIVHEDTRTMGFGAELAALAAEEALDVLKAPVCRVTAPDVAGIPTSAPMEDFVLPNRNKIADAVRQLVTKRVRQWGGVDLPQASAPTPVLDPWTRSALEIPQASSIVEVDLSQVMAYREAHRAAFQARGIDLTITSFVLQAAAGALVVVPEVNSAFEGESIRRYKSVDILLEVADGDVLKRGIIAQAETRACVFDLECRPSCPGWGDCGPVPELHQDISGRLPCAECMLREVCYANRCSHAQTR